MQLELIAMDKEQYEDFMAFTLVTYMKEKIKAGTWIPEHAESRALEDRAGFFRKGTPRKMLIFTGLLIWSSPLLLSSDLFGLISIEEIIRMNYSYTTLPFWMNTRTKDMVQRRCSFWKKRLENSRQISWDCMFLDTMSGLCICIRKWDMMLEVLRFIKSCHDSLLISRGKRYITNSPQWNM